MFSLSALRGLRQGQGAHTADFSCYNISLDTATDHILPFFIIVNLIGVNSVRGGVERLLTLKRDCITVIKGLLASRGQGSLCLCALERLARRLDTCEKSILFEK